MHSYTQWVINSKLSPKPLGLRQFLGTAMLFKANGCNTGHSCPQSPNIRKWAEQNGTFYAQHTAFLVDVADLRDAIDAIFRGEII